MLCYSYKQIKNFDVISHTHTLLYLNLKIGSAEKKTQKNLTLAHIDSINSKNVINAEIVQWNVLFLNHPQTDIM